MSPADRAALAARALAAATVAIGAAVLAGWALDVPWLKSLHPALVSMRVNTALCVLLMGAAAWLSHERAGPAARRAGTVLAAAAGAIAAASLSQDLLGRDLGIDEALFRADHDAIGATSPGRMAVSTAVCLILSALGLLAIERAASGRPRHADAAVALSGLIALVSFVGYLHQVPALHEPLPGAASLSPTAMAAHTAAALVLLNAAVLLGRPRSGLVAAFTATTAASAHARAILAGAVVLQLGLDLGQEEMVRRGWLAPVLGDAMHSLAVIVTLGVLAWWIADDGGRRERALAASEERFRELVESAPDGVLGVDGEGRVVLFNRQAELMFGYARDEVLGRPVEMLMPELHRQRHVSLRDAYLADPRVRHVVPRPRPVGRHKDGHEFEVENRLSPLGSSGGMVAMAVVRDVTVRRTMERSLRLSEERFRATFEQAAVGIAHVALDGRFLRLNRRFGDIAGYTREELLDRTFQQITHPDDLEADLANVEQLLAGVVDSYSMEKRYVRQDGGLVWINLTVSLVRDLSGEPEYLIAVIEDIGARLRAQQDLARVAAELERSNRDLEEFALVASHDLQEPVRKVVTFAHLVRQQAAAALDATTHDYLSRMEAAAERMNRLVEGLLELSRVATRARGFEPTDLRRVVSDALADLDDRVRESGARVEVGALPVLMGDPAQLRSLFQNLLANALKFRAPDRNPVVRVRSEGLDGPAWRIDVEDDGIGFDERDLARLFKPFQRLHAAGPYDGSGMGLAICRRIVARHGGEITARSRCGQGTAFSVTLPARPPAMGV